MNRSAATAIVVLVSGVALDQVTKTWARGTLALCEGPAAACERIPLAGPVGILNTANPAAALGFLELTGALFVFALVAPFMLGLSHRRPHPAMLVVMALLAAGVLGNLIDRVLVRAVTDFIDVRLGSGGVVLNLADVWLLLGGIGWVWLASGARRADLSRLESAA